MTNRLMKADDIQAGAFGISDPVQRALQRITHIDQTSIRNLMIEGHRTSIRIDTMIWEALGDIADAENMSVHALATQIARHRKGSISLTAAIRMFVVGYLDGVALKPIKDTKYQ